MYYLVWIRNARRIRHKVFKKQEQQIFSNNRIEYTFLRVCIHVVGITQSILFIVRMNLKNIFRFGQVRESIKKNHDGCEKSRQRTGETNIKILFFRVYF